MASLVEEQTTQEKAVPSRYFHQHLSTHLPTPTRLQRKKRLNVNIRVEIERVFGALGNWEGMLAWAKDNPDVFYGQVVPKLLPKDLGGGIGNITVIVQRNQVVSDPNQLNTVEATACMQIVEAQPQAAPDLRSESTNNCHAENKDE